MPCAARQEGRSGDHQGPARHCGGLGGCADQIIMLLPDAAGGL